MYLYTTFHLPNIALVTTTEPGNDISRKTDLHLFQMIQKCAEINFHIFQKYVTTHHFQVLEVHGVCGTPSSEVRKSPPNAKLIVRIKKYDIVAP